MLLRNSLADIVQAQLMEYLLQKQVASIEQAVVILLNQFRRRVGHHDLLLALLRLPVHLGNNPSGPSFRVFVFIDELVVGPELFDNASRALFCFCTIRFHDIEIFCAIFIDVNTQPHLNHPYIL